MSKRFPAGIHSKTYSEDRGVLRTPWRKGWAYAFALLLMLFPLVSGPYLLHIAIFIGIAVIIAQGLNILMGLCGQVSVAQAGFAAIGAYGFALTASRWHLPFPLTLILAGICAGGLGILVAYPSLRLKGWYLVFTSLAAQQIILFTIRHWKSVTGGDIGLSVPRIKIGGLVLRDDRIFYYLVAAGAVLATLFTLNLIRSKLGRAFIAVRDNDSAAAGLGIHVAGYKLLAFFICCGLAGLGGALRAHWESYLMPESWSLWDSIWYMGYLVIGGLGTVLGPVYGILFVTGLVEGMNALVTELVRNNPYSASFVAATREAVFGLVLIYFLAFEPRGLDHRVERILNTFRYWPFRRIDSPVIKG